jgi:hypothetical protein
MTEKPFITRCAPATITRYGVAYRTFKPIIGNELPTKANVFRFIIEARKAHILYKKP